MLHGTYTGGDVESKGKTALLYDKMPNGEPAPEGTLFAQFDDPDHPHATGWHAYIDSDFELDVKPECGCCGGVLSEAIGQVIRLPSGLSVRVEAGKDCEGCAFAGVPATSCCLWEPRFIGGSPEIDSFESVNNVICWVDGLIYREIANEGPYSEEGRRDSFRVDFDPDLIWAAFARIYPNPSMAQDFFVGLGIGEEFAECASIPASDMSLNYNNPDYWTNRREGFDEWEDYDTGGC